MRSNLTSQLGFFRSPSPIFFKEGQISQTTAKAPRVLVNNSNSYKKLKKVCINDTSLVFIHKLKEKHIKNTKRKLLNPLINEVHSGTSSIPLMIANSECSQRGSPLPPPYSPETSCLSTMYNRKKRYEREIFESKPMKSSFKSALHHGRYLAKPADTIKLRLNGLTKKSPLIRIPDVHFLNKTREDSSKNSTGVQVDSDISAWAT